MMKRKTSSTYVHKVNENPRAHESEDRKIHLLRNLEMKRYEKSLLRLRQEMMNYQSNEDKNQANRPIDPSYCLKGAARVAQAYYLPLNQSKIVKSLNLFETYQDKLYEHDLGKEYIQTLRDYGICLYNHGKKTKEAVKMFEEIIALDPQDRMRSHAYDHLLRCYMASAWGDKAREVIEKYSYHQSSCFLYNRVLLDIISYSLGETGSSEQVIEETLTQAVMGNPFTAWIIAYQDVFKNVFEQTELIDEYSVSYGSLEDAIKYSEVEYELWKETSNAVNIIRDYVDSHPKYRPDTKAATKEIEKSPTLNSEESNHLMFLRMFETGIEMIDYQNENNRKKKRS